MDVDPKRAKIIGRVALAKIGYLPIMRLAREAGWVTRKKRESARRSDPALISQTAGGFIEVFSKYAVVAGVTSQADSPLPGPGDAAAIGIIVIGLIDAGLLAGAILHAIEDAATTTTITTTSSPPVATAMPMASATPTTTAPPIPIAAPVPSKADCAKAIKLLEQVRRLAQNLGKKLSDKRLRALQQAISDGTITSDNLPGDIKNEFPGGLKGKSLNEIRRLCGKAR
jgi:hypothetical protein